ncbi:MAG: hypothetical protein RLZZ621_2370 [Gemmatimonadota bacterium]|jgi:Ca2+-transporting ATPase
MMPRPVPLVTPRESALPWHAQAADTVVATLDSHAEHGLTSDDVLARRARVGENVLAATRRRRVDRLILAQFRDVMVLVLLGAALIAGVLGEPEDTIAILAIVILNALLGFVQEFRAERAMAALGALSAPAARVRRNGKDETVPASALVPGDLVLLEAGQIVPADVRLLTAHALRVEEAALTGESQPVTKQQTPVGGDAPLGDQFSMAFKGTIVSAGRGCGVVVATGARTQLGRIATLLEETDDARSPLQQRLAAFGRQLALLVIGLCVVIFAAGLLRGEPLGLMFMTALSLAVAAIPEALPAVITVSLALGARRMVRREALIRRLPAVETLGSVTYICSDKTGTLTENRMRVDSVRWGDGVHIDVAQWSHEHDTGIRPTELLALCNDVVQQPDGSLVGDPTETALVEAARHHGVDYETLTRQWPRLEEIPFTSERARMTTVHRRADGNAEGVLVCSKGAPERMIRDCTHMHTAQGLVPIDADRVMDTADGMAAAGLRVLALATRTMPTMPSPLDAVERELHLLALIGLLDPPRAEAQEAVRVCQRAGIHVVMITGDHPATARAIAQRLGIAGPEDDVLTGAALLALDDEALAERVSRTRVYARVTPDDKVRLVQALQAQGEFVAMTGDGVNDAPALQGANIGVAMGRGGTDVAREAAHMVLLDDNFATIVNAVREGRRIYDNIRRFVRFVLSTNAGEIWTLFLAPLIGLPLPLLPIHILWMNLVTDGLPGLALSAEREEPGVMERPPRPPKESLFAHGLWQHAVWVGLLMALLALGTQAWALHHNNPRWQTMTFTVLTLSQLAHVLAIRSETRSMLAIGWRSNPALLGAVLLTTALQLLVIYHPGMAGIFRAAPLTLFEFLLCVGISALVFVAVEVEKVFIRHWGWYGTTARRT